MKKHLLAIFLVFNIYAFSSTPESTPDILEASEEKVSQTDEDLEFMVKLGMFLDEAIKNRNGKLTCTAHEMCLETKKNVYLPSLQSNRVCVPLATVLSFLTKQGLPVNDLDPKELDGLRIEGSKSNLIK